MDCHALLRGIFLTQGSNPHLLSLLHWQAYSSPLHHLGGFLIDKLEIELVKNKQTAVYPLVVIHLLSHVQLFATPWNTAIRLLCPALSPSVCSNSYS